MLLVLKIIIALIVTFGVIKIGEKIDIRYSALITSFPTIVALVIFFCIL